MAETTERNATLRRKRRSGKMPQNSTAAGTVSTLPISPSRCTRPEPQLASGVTDGYVDTVDGLTLNGWVVAALRTAQFFVEVNGAVQHVQPRFYAREDLIALGIDGIGFTTHYRLESHAATISVCYRIDMDGPIRYLCSSGTHRAEIEVAGFDPRNVIVATEDLMALAKALDADTQVYIGFLQKYAHALGGIGANFDVLFVDGTEWSISTRYRILNIADGLIEQGFSTVYARLDQIEPEIIGRISARTVVFFRAPLDHRHRYLMDRFRAKGSRIVYDIDDLVFDERIIQDIDGVRFLQHKQVTQYISGMRSYRQFILAADVVTTSTEYLAHYARSTLDLTTTVVRNSLGKSYLRNYRADEVVYLREGPGFLIGYYSGSRTHQADFAVVASALGQLMRSYYDIRLRLVGAFDLSEFPDLASLASRIETVPMMSYHLMIEDLASVDVILAPLEVADPYCESKSELKWFEAALRGRPCVASPTRAFAEAIGNDEYGRLATTTEDWHRALTELYLSPTIRREISMRARKRAQEQFSYQVAAAEASQAYFSVEPAPQPQCLIATSRTVTTRPRLTAGVVMPEISVGGGGQRKIFQICRALADQGVDVTIYVDSQSSPAANKRTIEAQFAVFPFTCKAFRGLVGEHDVTVCTHWTTAYHLRSHPKPDRVVYFIQDYEPMFDAVGSRYMQALSTYRLGFRLLCYGDWVANRLRAELDVEPHTLPFSVDRTVYRPRPRLAQSIDVLFYARPSQPRRCFELGIEALQLMWQLNKTIRIGLFGEASHGDIGFTYHDFGYISDPDELGRLYARSRLGLCFSTTNPSLVGYEMIGSGLPLLDLRIPGCAANFGGEQFVYYAEAAPEAIAKQIGRALSDDAERAARRDAGLTYVDGMAPETAFSLSAAAFMIDSAQSRAM